MRIAAFAGPSNSGKTTMICAVIRRCVERGDTVGAIKHTHHPLTMERRGDTEQFLAAGAAPVILAARDEAVIFDRDVRTVRFTTPADLLAYLPVSVVLVEGFKEFDGWPRVGSVEEALSVLDRIR
jgi:molybdopterin-guanine dinucleotide biosynthesis protein B